MRLTRIDVGDPDFLPLHPESVAIHDAVGAPARVAAAAFSETIEGNRPRVRKWVSDFQSVV